MIQPIKFQDLPPVKSRLDDGTFAGITTNPKGQHYAVVLLDPQGSNLTHSEAVAWAAANGGELPTRPVAAMVYANLKNLLREKWHWTADTLGASCAWICNFFNGTQDCDHKSSEGSAVAVKLIPILP